jgi:hypothetical protein
MANYHQDALNALRQAGETMQQAGQRVAEGVQLMIQSHQHLIRAAEFVTGAHGEQEDQRDTVQRLEALVMDLSNRIVEQGHDIRELRRRLNGSAE